MKKRTLPRLSAFICALLLAANLAGCSHAPVSPLPTGEAPAGDAQATVPTQTEDPTTPVTTAPQTPDDGPTDAPTEPTAPTEPSAPTEASSPTEPTRPADPPKPTNPPKPSEPPKPTNPPKPSEPPKPTNPPKPSEPPKPTNPPKPTDPAPSLADAILRELNIRRAADGLAPLRMDAALRAMADIRASECAVSFSHTRPDGRDCFSIFSDHEYSGYSTAGENILYCSSGYTAADMADMWMNSDGHRANIMNPKFTGAGIGVFEKNGIIYVANLFVG